MIAALIVAISATTGQTATAKAGWHTIALSPLLSVAVPTSAVAMNLADPKVNGMHVWGFRGMKGGYVAQVMEAVTPKMKATEPDEALATAEAGMAGDYGTLVQERDIVYKGWPGVDVVMTSPKGIAMFAREVFVDHNIYIVGESYLAANGRPADANDYLDSLTVTPTPAQGPWKTPGPIFTTFHPQSGGYEIDMPGKPTDTSFSAPDRPELVMERFEKGFGMRNFTIASTEVPDQVSAEQARLDAQNGLLNFLKAKPTGKSAAVTRDKVQFLSVEFLVGDGFAGRLDVADVPPHCYLILMTYPAGHRGSPDIDTFFNSFHVK